MPTETYPEWQARRHREDLLARRARARAALVDGHAASALAEEHAPQVFMSGFDRLTLEVARYLAFMDEARS